MTTMITPTSPTAPPAHSVPRLRDGVVGAACLPGRGVLPPPPDVAATLLRPSLDPDLPLGALAPPWRLWARLASLALWPPVGFGLLPPVVFPPCVSAIVFPRRRGNGPGE